MTMKIIKTLFRVFLFFSTMALYAQEKQDEKIKRSTEVIKEFAGLEEKIPAILMRKAEGVVIIPTLINAGLAGVGGQRGRGLAMVKRADGTWSDPVFVSLTGGSVGFQFGLQATDLVLVFTKGSILTSLEKGEFNFGGSAAVTAGPLGRSSSASTDTRFNAEVYSYSRSKGLFAGITINGSKLAMDARLNKAYYKNDAPASEIFSRSPSIEDQEIIALRDALKSLY
jgi:lipid-binding SYLF domain-containing protein